MQKSEEVLHAGGDIHGGVSEMPLSGREAKDNSAKDAG